MGLFNRPGKPANPAEAAGSNEESEAARLVDEGNLLEDAGQFAQALERYDAATRVAPMLARAHLNRGNVLLASGNLEGAEIAYRDALERDATYAAAHFNLGNIALRLGDNQRAVDSYERTLRLRPDLVDAELALGHALGLRRDYAAAAARFQGFLAKRPDHVPALVGLGGAFTELGRTNEARTVLARALEVDPASVDAHIGMANAWRRAGQGGHAVAAACRAVALAPTLAAAHYAKGQAEQTRGDLQAGEACLRRAIELDPQVAEYHNDLGNVLLAQGRADASVQSYLRALESNPGQPVIWSNLGNAYQQLGRLNDALASQQAALRHDARLPQAHCNLANVLRDMGRQSEALISYRKAVELDPASAIAQASLGNLLKDIGALEEADRHFRRAIALEPAYHEAHTSHLFCLSHDDTVGPVELFSEHRAFGVRFEVPSHRRVRHANERDPDRTLRVGVVSADLREHPIAYFFEPVLRELRRDRGIALFAYSNHPKQDAATLRMRGQFAHWTSIVGMSDEKLVELIVADGVDIIIDLSGHTAGNRLLALARKPAPIQASWMGYPGTTGLQAIDYYFADRHFLPLEEFGSQFTEKLVHLPASAPFLPEPGSPAVNALPALRSGDVTFGSFNRLSKLSPRVIALWSQLLRAHPNARMLLGAMPQDGQYGQLPEWFAGEGIARDRLEFHARCDPATYLALHHRVDVCLDTFPYTGGTTTAHALWMGVPSLTMAGTTPAGRQGAAILGHVGLEAFIAKDLEDYVRKGMQWVGDLGTLAALRAQMRDRFARSNLARPDVIAEGLQKALRIMWRRWCAGGPPQPIGVVAETDGEEASL
jgi:predicted O-linked N-acetylglucosamine transferase (SPINDLY family)